MNHSPSAHSLQDAISTFNQNWGRYLAPGFFLLLIAFSLTGCKTKSFLSTKQEINLGNEGARQVEQQNQVDTTSPEAVRVRRIGESLIPHMADGRNVPYSFKVIDSITVNAFSLPGGPVYVYRGLLEQIGNDDDALACVLGHEAGHINARHAARQISSQMASQTLIDLAIQNPTYHNLAGIGEQLASLKYSRDDEYAADIRGISYAHAAGYDPEGLIRFFHKLEAIEKTSSGGTPVWLRDHPLTLSRITKAQTIIDHHDFRFGK